ncbi:molybdate ABC transporter substrate-binding protein [Aquihabitans daechungensis]|uniref:molybdate ABC transporter substrate-binding protein n=1 Tax=Aquihabitans daechungensis TaxID=1052257 RepID=UPI003BA33535
MRTHRRLLVLTALVAVIGASCGDPGPGEGGGRAGAGLEGTLTVSAAASLTESFTDIGTAFEADHPGTTITFTFDSSGTLSQQILDGAPAEVFASADEQSMNRLDDAELVPGEPTVFARNQLAIVTKPGNPEGIESLADLADAGIISLCGEDVPCGHLAAESLDHAGVTIPERSVTRGQNAKAALAAVREGDAVAGIVYVTDVRAAGNAVDSVEIPAEDNVVATYPAAVLAGAEDAALARAFVTYLSSDDAQAVLAGRGFLPAS